MEKELLYAVISAGTSILVVFLSQVFFRFNEKRKLAETELEQIRKEYINPLRFMIAENYFRISEIIDMVNDGKKHIICTIQNPLEIKDKDESWFVGEGCYLMSSCYLTACLFVYIENIRLGSPFLRLPSKNDTKLMSYLNKISVDFSHNLFIYYILQMDIGRDFYIKDEHRVLTYREFYSLLKDDKAIHWYQSLINSYLMMGKGEVPKIQELLHNLKELAGLLDSIVSGGDSIKQKLSAEADFKS